jgi:hypothetical protein
MASGNQCCFDPVLTPSPPPPPAANFQPFRKEQTMPNNLDVLNWIAGGRWRNLKGADVVAVLDRFDLTNQPQAACIILRKRPDLKREVLEALADLEADSML